MRTDRRDSPLTIAVTGASGFVGGALVRRLAEDPGFVCRPFYRQAPDTVPSNCDVGIVPDLLDVATWQDALAGADVVVHAAARAHVMGERADDALALYRRINTEGTLALARAAAAAGVRRFVFLSSIKVNGESTPIDRPFTEADPPAPEDAYGISKHEAEAGLRQLARKTAIEVVVLRPALVLGPGAKGNLARLGRSIARGIPLPFGAIRNLRSLVGIESLCDAIVAAATRKGAAGRTYLIADRDLSTPDLVRQLAHAVGRPAHLLPVPPALLRLGGRFVGRAEEIERLVGSLRVDATLARRELGLLPYTALAAGPSAPD